MPTSAYVLGFLVVTLTAAFAVAYHFVPLYWAYQATEAYRRAEAVRREVARLRGELRDAQARPPAVLVEAIRADAWGDCLRGVSVHALKSYPGVGEVTVQRLADAGYRTLHDADGRLTQPTFTVTGIGPSRVGEVCAAARAELRRQRQDFDRGDNRFAREAEAKIRQLTAARDATVVERQADQARAQSAMSRLEPQRAAAAKVTFWAFLRHRRAAPDRPWPCDPALEMSPPVPQPLPPAPGQAVVALPVARRVQPEAVADPPAPQRPPTNVEAIATVLLAVARADGKLAAAERAAVRRGLAKFFEGDPVLVRHIDPTLERLAAATLDTDAALRLAAGLPRRDRDSLRQCADEVNAAMGTRHPARDKMLARIAQALTLPGEVTVPPPVNPAELRDNVLLDGMFGGPEPAPVALPVAVGQGLRDNALLDDVFGGR